MNDMKKIIRRTSFFLIICMICTLSLSVLSGCGQKTVGNTIPEPEITTDYLEDEYAQQLMTDGAEMIQGSVTIEQSNDSYIVHIVEKEIIPSDDYEEGYYIADTNLTRDVLLGFDARIVCLENDEPVLSDADSFIENHPAGSEEFYTIYLMGDSAELIMPVDPSAMIE